MIALIDRIVDVMEALARVTVLLWPHADQVVDRYSERAETDSPVQTPADKAGLVPADRLA